MAERTLYRMFLDTVEAHGDRNAVGFKVGKAAEYTYWTYRQLDQKVRDFARGLDALGLRAGDRLALTSHENQVEWAIADLASQYLGIITVPIYGTLPASQVAYYIQNSGARGLVLSDSKQRTKLRQFRAETPSLEFVIAMEGSQEELNADGILAFETVYQRGASEGRDGGTLHRLFEAVRADDTATLIYTSGTTGNPKGAELSHSNILQTPDGVVDKKIADVNENDVFLSFLPLSHITERVAGHFLPLRLGACIVYSQGLMALRDEIQTTVRPTAMLCVPRLWENMHNKAMEAIDKKPEKERKIAYWGLNVGIKVAQHRSEGKWIDPFLQIQYAIADRLVLSKIREQATGGRIRNCVSGGAPLDPKTAEFYLGIGIQLLEGYGLSETNIIAINRPFHQRIGTVGNLMPYTELKFADDGEILVRGQGRMKGYYQMPDATREAIDPEGWFHTGDIGTLSKDGYLQITDRKKDMLVLSNGKKVAPQPIEALLKHSPYIAEAVLLGDKAATVSALLLPEFDSRGRPAALIAWAKEKGLPTDDTDALLNSPEVQKLFRSEIERCTPDLADFEKIKRFKLVPKPFGIESGELTPTLKVKRRFVIDKYKDLIESMGRG